MIFQFHDILAQNFDERGDLPLQYYSNREYNLLPQNFSIIQGKDKIMYFGNNGGCILEYDGVKWKQIEIGDLPVRSFAINENGIIFVGAESEFGYLLPDDNGAWRYTQLLCSNDSVEFTRVKNIISTRDGVYFQTDNFTFLFSNSSLKKWKSDTKVFYSFYLDGSYFICQENIGLSILQKEKIIPVNNHSIFKERIMSVCPYDRGVALIATKEKGLYLWRSYLKVDGGTLEPFITEADEIFDITPVSSCIKLDNFTYSIGTVGGGLVIIDKDGHFVHRIDKNSVLQGDVIEQQYLDDMKDIWLATAKGITKVETSSPYTVFNENSGIKGSVQKICRFNGILYAATNRGLFYLNKGKLVNYSFQKIEKINMAVWEMLTITIDNESLLLLALDDGVYEYTTNGTLNRIISCIPWTMCPSTVMPNRVFVGLDGQGLTTLTKVNGKWIEEKTTKTDGVVRNITEDVMGNLWLGSPNSELTKMILNPNISKSEFITWGKGDGMPEGMCYAEFSDEKDFICTSEGLYFYSKKDNHFYPDSLMSNKFGKSNMHIHRVASDNKGNTWMVVVRNQPIKFEIGYFTHYGSDESEWKSKEFNKISLNLIHTIYHDKSGVTWLGGDNGIFRYDQNVKISLGGEYNALIRKVTTVNDSVIFYGTFIDGDSLITVNQPSSFIPILPFEENGLTFEFSAQKNDKEAEMVFSFICEGETSHWTEWSEWKTNTTKDFTNLHEGKYVFRVKAKDIYGHESLEAKYEFIILPPWYRTYLAYTCYALFSLLFLFTGVRLNSGRLRAKNANLEKIVKERTAEINEKNKVLEKLSIVARETDNSVIIADSSGKITWANEGFTRLMGYKLDEFTMKYGNNLLDISGHSDIKEILEEAIREKKSFEYLSENTTKDGGKIWLQTTITPVFDKNGNHTELVAIDSNITKIKRAEEEILEQQKELVKAFKQSSRQQTALHKAMTQIEDQKNEITDSIQYALRIQKAVLPTPEFFAEIFPDSFALFKPKDIVSGDFYWTTRIRNYAVVVAADCTGHGVPGAFMSMLGVAFLSEIVNKEGVLVASQILNELRQHVIRSLRQKGVTGESKDGMDIAICVIKDLNETEEVNAEFAGANNPLFIIRKDSNNDENKADSIIEEIKADKMPIGIYEKMPDFSNKDVKLYKGDKIYMFSDGYADQFGGEKGKKMKTKPFKRLLVKNHLLSMSEQCVELENAHQEWKRGFEQIDDIVVLGIRI